eukprot:1141682-Pelagomonas_calceolata.AAC.5
MIGGPHSCDQEINDDVASASRLLMDVPQCDKAPGACRPEHGTVVFNQQGLFLLSVPMGVGIEGGARFSFPDVLPFPEASIPDMSPVFGFSTNIMEA